MQSVRNWEKLLQKSGLHEASPKWETKEYMYYGIFCFGWFYWLLKGLLFKATQEEESYENQPQNTTQECNKQ